jgi:hypothetical protein
MTDIIYPSEDLLRQLIEAARQVPALQARIRQLELRTDNSPQWHVHNDSGEEIPAYACMQVTGTEELYEQTYLLVDKPADTDGTAGWFVFNGPNAIATGDEGTIQKGPVYRGFKNVGTASGGESWQPVVGQWYIESGGSQFVAAGDDNVDDDVVRVFIPGGGGGAATKFYRYRLSTDMVEYLPGRYVANGVVQELTLNNTTTFQAFTPGQPVAAIYDPIGVAAHQLEDDEGICVSISANRYAILEPQCIFAFPPGGGSGGSGQVPISPTPIVP